MFEVNYIPYVYRNFIEIRNGQYTQKAEKEGLLIKERRLFIFWFYSKQQIRDRLSI